MLNTYLKDNKSSSSSRSVYLSEEFADDPEFQKLLQQFVNGLPGIVDKIHHATIEQDWDTAQSLSHNLKGVGGNYGFPEISDIAQKINTDIKSEQYGRIDVLVAELTAECGRIVKNHQDRRAS